MVWNNLKMKIPWKKHPTGVTEQRLGALINFDRMMRRLNSEVKNFTRTSNPKGKVGVVEDNGRWLDFGEKRFNFRKFEKKPFDNAEGFIKGLERRGFKKIGSGAFSTVLAKEGSKRVIKVIRRPDGWINYVHWAATNGFAGKFAPMVFSYKKIKGRKGEFAIASMERLKYTLNGVPQEHALKILPGLMGRVDHNEMAKKFVDVLAPGLSDFLTRMSEKWKIPPWNFDFHDGNLMVRTDGSFVIVDPVSRGEEGFNRLRAGDLSPVLKSLGILIASRNRYRGQWAH